MNDSPPDDAQFLELYDELKSYARRQMRRERASHTLSPTALVHEAWLRIGGRPGGWASRAELYFAAATAMRRILVESARSRSRRKRGGDRARITLGSQDLRVDVDPTDVLALEEGMERLSRESSRAERVAQLSLFAGLGVPEIADVLGVSVATVKRDILFFKAFLGDVLLSHREAPDNGSR